MKHHLAILILCCVIFTSCNPLRRIDMKNRSDSDVEITWLLKERDSMYSSPLFMNNSREVKFKLKPDKPYNIIKWSFGDGNWKLPYLKEITEHLESLEIKSGNGTVLLSSPEEIYSFLVSRRTGIGKRKIAIVIND